MSKSNNLKQIVKDRVAELRTLRDEIRLDLHLAGKELSEEWSRLDNQSLPAVASAEHAAGLTTDAVDALVDEVRKFRSRLQERRSQRGSVERVMSQQVVACGPNDTLDVAVGKMWDNDIGCVPVVAADGRLVGMLTDRDACIATYTRNCRLSDITVDSVMSRDICACRPGDKLSEVANLLSTHKLRRLPVVDLQDRLVGMITLNDLAREAARPDAANNGEPDADQVSLTLAQVAEPRRGSTAWQ